MKTGGALSLGRFIGRALEIKGGRRVPARGRIFGKKQYDSEVRNYVQKHKTALPPEMRQSSWGTFRLKWLGFGLPISPEPLPHSGNYALKGFKGFALA